jgi:hypothetical protein
MTAILILVAVRTSYLATVHFCSQVQDQFCVWPYKDTLKTQVYIVEIIYSLYILFAECIK